MPLIGLLGLLAGLGGAAEPLVVPALGSPAAAARRAVPVRVVWDGPPADVRVGPPDATLLVAASARSPFTLGRLEPGHVVELVRDGAAVATADGALVWTPADVAAWSGPGLRAATVTALAPAQGGLWVGTDGAGVALWDGRGFGHLGRRQGLPDAVVDVALGGDVRWIADVDGVTRVDGGGRTARWRVGVDLRGPVAALHAASPDAALVATDGAVVAIGVDADGGAHAITLLEDRACIALIGEPRPAASCAHLWRDLDPTCAADPAVPCPTPTLVPSVAPGLRAWVPRVGGAWLAWEGALAVDAETSPIPVWTPPSGHLRDATVLGRGLLIAAGDDGAWHGDDEGFVRVPRAAGLPSDRALVVAPGPSVGKAWLGTDRGVALVTEADTATPLPLAPLAAGLGAIAVAAGRDATLVASDDGLAWLGRPPVGADTLIAGVTGPVVDVARAGRSWWVLGTGQVWRLDRRGRLDRWDLAGRGVGLAAVGEAVAVATADGLRWWLPGATMLGPLDALPGLRTLVAGPDGSLWALAGDAVHRLDVRGTPRAWDLPGARALTVTAWGALAATPDGLVGLAPSQDVPVVPDDPALAVDVRAVALGGGGLWTLDDDGAVRFDGRLVATVAGPRGLEVDAAGAWVLTDAGLWRIVP